MLKPLAVLAPPATQSATPPSPQLKLGGDSESGAHGAQRSHLSQSPQSPQRPQRSFAREMERARPKEAAPAPRPNAESQAHAARNAAPTAAQAHAGTAPPAHGKTAATAPRSRTEPSPKPSTEAEPSATDLRDGQAGKSVEPDDAAAAAAADLISLMAGLMTPAAPAGLMAPAAPAAPAAQAAPAATQGLAAHDGAAATAAAHAVGVRHRESGHENDDLRAATAVNAMLAPGKIAAEADSGTGGHGALRDDAAASAPSARSQRSDTALFALPQLAAPAPLSLLSPSPAGTASATPYAAQIAAPVGSPDFAPGLSAQLSVMVRDGLQEARLHLNPPEMGPITVQIQIEGLEAQVMMVAEQAPTRQALEQAMPTLASALREGGLTLTGGGVFEQAPQQTEQQAQQDRHEQQARRDAAPSHASAQARRGDDLLAAHGSPAARAGSHRGVLDLYA